MLAAYWWRGWDERPKYGLKYRRDGSASIAEAGRLGIHWVSLPPSAMLLNSNRQSATSTMESETRSPAVRLRLPSVKLCSEAEAKARAASTTVDLPALFGPTRTVSPLPGRPSGIAKCKVCSVANPRSPLIESDLMVKAEPISMIGVGQSSSSAESASNRERRRCSRRSVHRLSASTLASRRPIQAGPSRMENSLEVGPHRLNWRRRRDPCPGIPRATKAGERCGQRTRA